VPLAGAAPRGEEMAVRWTKSEVKDAPHADPDGQLTELEETELYRHYGIDATEAQTGDRAAREASIDERTTDGAMTRSEEELHVGVERVESGRVRLRKYVVTEHKTVNVPVQHEEVRVVREPVSAGSEGAAVGDAEIGEDQHEVVLHEERPVVSTETVPKETVRLETDTVTEQRTAEGDVRKEQLEVEGDPSQGR
jgi:uncharacterized protein (TIGR02271 family)